MKRRFACNRFKSYAIRNHKFENGLFETEDPDVIKLIEGADGYGVFIHPCETPEEIEAMRTAEVRAQRHTPTVIAPALEPEVEEEQPPIAHQGARGTASGKGQRRGHIITGKDK